MKSICLLSIALSLSSAAFAQQGKANPPVVDQPLLLTDSVVETIQTGRAAPAEPGFFFLEPGGHEFLELLARIVRATETEILIHPNIRAQCEQIAAITLDRPLRLNAEHALSWFSCMVYSHHLLLTRLGPPIGDKPAMMELVRCQDSINHPVETRAEHLTTAQVLAAPTRHMVVTTLMTLKDPMSAETLGRYETMFTTQRTHLALQAVSAGRAVLLQGLQCDVAKVVRLFQLAESPDEANGRAPVESSSVERPNPRPHHQTPQTGRNEEPTATNRRQP